MTHKLLQLALASGTPLIDSGTATFVWQGQHAPQLIGDFTDWEDGAPASLSRTAPGVWRYPLALPADAYIEYSFYENGQRLPDPFNPRTAPDGFGHLNHWFYMPAGGPTPLAQRQPKTPRGAVTRHAVETGDLAVGKRRTVYLYQPATSEPSPLLVVWDGPDYLRRGGLAAIVDNLIAQQRIRPIAMALIENARQARSVEYACSETTLGFLMEKVLPLAQASLRLGDVAANPGSYGVLGASMGGLMALFAGLRLPHIFGRVLSQSGSFTLGRDTVVYDLVQHAPVRPLEIWMDAGRYEGLLDTNRRVHDLLAGYGYAVTYREYNGGHNYPSWRDDVWRGLEHLFGSQC